MLELSAPLCDNADMTIQLNGHERPLTDAMTLADLLAAEGLAGRRIAVELNGEIIPRTLHDQTLLSVGDVVEIVHALGGG